ncbi:hypothetical protein G9P44_005250 [Scheffersomyces stipitis]|nr:hypothetical protein G9P44_005250 [Scheffersomyces stipitis]
MLLSRINTPTLLSRTIIHRHSILGRTRLLSNVYSKKPISCTSLLRSPKQLATFRQVKFFSTDQRPQKEKQNPTIVQQLRSDPSLWTIPNILTYTRIITTPFIGYFIVQGETSLALSLFVYSSITDFVDGYIARRFNMKSVVGSIIDPLADKFLMTVCTLSLAYVSSIPALVASVIIGRDVMLSFMSFYYRYKSLEPPRTLDKFISIRSNPTITVHPNLLGKINTGLQMVYIGGLVFKPAIESFLGIDLETAALGMGTLVSATTLLSGITYVLNRNSFKYIK